jgi:hypothetical protein
VQVPITLGNMGSLSDGMAEIVINDAIRRAVTDLEDRGKDGKPRVVAILLTLQNMSDNEAVMISVEAEAKLPKYRTPNTLALHKMEKGEATVQFQTRSASNPYQRTLDEVERKDGSSD